jgi:hypothetical protein
MRAAPRRCGAAVSPKHRPANRAKSIPPGMHQGVVRRICPVAWSMYCLDRRDLVLAELCGRYEAVGERGVAEVRSASLETAMDAGRGDFSGLVSSPWALRGP